MNTCSSVDDEHFRRAPKVPPDKMVESMKLWHELNVVSENEKASEKSRLHSAGPESFKLSRFLPEAASPTCSSLGFNSCRKNRYTVTSSSPILSVQHAAPTLFCPSESANFPQTIPSSRLSSELGGPLPKSSNEEGYKLQPLKVISFSNISSAEWHSPEIKTSTPRPVLKPGVVQAAILHILSIEGWWRARCKPPEEVTLGGRHLHGVAGFPMPVSEPDRIQADSPRFTKQELVQRVLKPPDRMAVRRPSNEVVGKFDFRRGFRRSPNRVRFASSPHIFRCLRTAFEISH